MRTAFLPSAGLGKRLRPMTERLPKPLLEVAGEPIICHVMRHCASVGVQRFIINTSHLHEAFEVAFPDHEWEGIPIEFVYEPERLETGGGLKNIEHLLDDDEPLLIYNSDILTDLPLDFLYQQHYDKNRPLISLASTLAGTELHLITDASGYLLDVEREPESTTPNRQQFLGIALIEPDFLQFLQKDIPESIVYGWKRALESRPQSIRTCEIPSGRWQDIGTLSAYEAVRETGLRAQGISLEAPSVLK